MKNIWLPYSLAELYFSPLIMVVLFSYVIFTVVEEKHEVREPTPFQYNWQDPDTTYYLPLQLAEISGLAYNTHKEVLLTIQDETGDYYEVDPQSGKILSEKSFTKKGDFEGIALSGDTTYILQSNGTIYKIHNENIYEFNTILKSRNDAEGLCLSSDHSQLLVACKGSPLGSKKSKKTKAIYSWNTETTSLEEDPYLTVAKDDLIHFYRENYRQTLSKSEWKKAKNRIKDFSPSAIAIHPQGQDLYILSARGSLLVVMDNNKNLQSIVFLDKKRNPQPEGICFDSKGTAYISTEGQGLLGKIFVFHQHNTLK